jgi:hypothetical protein
MTRIHNKLKKLNSPKKQWSNEEMGKWTEQRVFLKEVVQMAKNHGEMLNLFGQKGNANQNHI